MSTVAVTVDGTSGVRTERARPILIAAWGLLVLVLVISLAHHDLWFDELQAWNIARASHSLGNLYQNLRYEGHPILWYVPLFMLTRFTGDPYAMQVLELGVVSASAAVLLFRSPFPVPLRIAAVFGYCVLFEFGVMSRSYGLEVLFLFVALVALARPRPAWWGGGLALGALAWTTVPGAVLAVAVIVAFVASAQRAPCARHEHSSWVCLVRLVLPRSPASRRRITRASTAGWQVRHTSARAR
jgi:hypothetical protein